MAKTIITLCAPMLRDRITVTFNHGTRMWEAWENGRVIAQDRHRECLPY